MTKLWLGGTAVLLALFVVVVWRNEVVTKKLNAANQRAWEAEQTLETERKAREHEQRIAKESSDAYQAELDRIRSSPDLGPVRLCKRATALPAAPATGAATGSDEGPARHVQEPDEVDIGPQLNDFVEDCEANAAQLDKLQSWVRSR